MTKLTKQQQEIVREFEELRKSSHFTYNGGYHEDNEREIFHHGINTAFNVIEQFLLDQVTKAEKRGERKAREGDIRVLEGLKPEKNHCYDEVTDGKCGNCYYKEALTDAQEAIKKEYETN